MLQVISQYLSTLPEIKPKLEKFGFTLHEYPQPLHNLTYLSHLKHLEIHYSKWTYGENLRTLLAYIRTHPNLNYRLRSVKLDEKPIPLPVTLTTTTPITPMTVEEFQNEIKKLNNPNIFIDHAIAIQAPLRRK